jgi:two-component system cell cycle response regulator DivK
VPRVLIVDDNERNVKLARDVLRAAGFTTLEAATGAEAIAIAVEHVPDVILMDLRLPDMDGEDAARALRQDERTAGVPVVALSALRVGGDEWVRNAGFTGYLEKPINVDEFPDRVRSYCAGA